MTRRRKLLLCFVAVATLVVVTTICSRDPEPTFKGLTLSQWTAKLGGIQENPFIFYVSRSEGTDEAVRAFGTNAIPFLLRWLRHETPTWKTALYRLSPNWFRWSRLGERILRDAANDKADAAVFGLIALRDDAQATIPTLGMMMLDRKHPYAARRAAVVLQSAWPSAFQAMDEARPKPMLDPAQPIWFRITVRAPIPSTVTNPAALIWLKGLTNALPLHGP